MKKIYAIALAGAAALGGATAQAGDGFIGGSLGFEHIESKGTNGKNRFVILPEIGYNFNDKWAIGTEIGYDYTHFNGIDTDTHLFVFNPYARFTYFRTSNNLVQLFIDGGAGIGCGWTDYGDDDDSHTAVTWNVGLKPGVAINFTDSFSMVAHLGFVGYQGANNAAFDGGHIRKGGIMFTPNTLNLGFYFNF